MIQVREVFQLQFGRAREAIALAREGAAIEARHGGVQARILTDLTGDYYTLVLESDHESLAAFERFLESAMASAEFRAWYPRFAALVSSGRREIFRVVSPAPAASPQMVVEVGA